jgi:hypothetical protein
MTKFTSQYDNLEREYHPAVMPGWLPIERVTAIAEISSRIGQLQIESLECP